MGSGYKNTFVNAFNTLVGHADELFGPIIQGVKRIQEANGLHEALGTLNQKKLELKEQRHILRQLKANECIDSALYFEESRKIERELSRCRSEEKQLHSRGTHQDTITGLQATLHQIQGYDGKMQAFDGDQFILLVRKSLWERNGSWASICGADLTYMNRSYDRRDAM